MGDTRMQVHRGVVSVWNAGATSLVLMLSAFMLLGMLGYQSGLMLESKRVSVDTHNDGHAQRRLQSSIADAEPKCQALMEMNGRSTFEALLTHMAWWQEHGCTFPDHHEKAIVEATMANPVFHECVGTDSMSLATCDQWAQSKGRTSFVDLQGHTGWWSAHGCSYPYHPDRSEATLWRSDIVFLKCAALLVVGESTLMPATTALPTTGAPTLMPTTKTLPQTHAPTITTLPSTQPPASTLPLATSPSSGRDDGRRRLESFLADSNPFV